jgi:hypothetical protein
MKVQFSKKLVVAACKQRRETVGLGRAYARTRKSGKSPSSNRPGFLCKAMRS